MVLAPGLPLLDASSLEIEVPAGSHGVFLPSADDVSNCAHAETELNTQVRQGLCGYFDNFGAWGVWSSVTLDRHVEVFHSGLVGFWLRGLLTGKLWVMLGAAGPETEDLIGSRLIPKATCDCQTLHPMRPSDAFSGQADFWELWSHEGLPSVVECATQPSRESYCSLQSSTTSTLEITTTVAASTSTSDATSSTSSSSSSSSAVSSTPLTLSSRLTSSSTRSPSTSLETTQPSTTSATTQATTTHGSLEAMGCGRDCPFRRQQEASMWRMQRDMAIRYSCDPVVDFVRGMIPHHQGAVEMCAALDASQTWAQVGLVHFCSHVALGQTWEVRAMRQWLNEREISQREACEEDCNLTCDSAKAFDAANSRMHKAMAINYSCDVEEDFVQAMLPHHQGAVDMCAVLLSSTKDVWFLELCTNITRMQAAEMAWMQEWLQYQGKPVGASCHAVAVQSYCADLMPITDLCHDLGGDRLCNCSGLVASCSTTARAAGRRFAVATVCRKSCGLCEATGAQDIVLDLLRLAPVTTMAATTTTTRRMAVASGAHGWLLPWLLLGSVL